MKRFFAMFFAALAMICVATACDDEPEVVPEVKKFLELTPVTIKAADVAAEYSFTVKASHPWTAECESDWVKVKKIWGAEGEHTVAIAVQTSNLESGRTATIVVKSEKAELTKSVKVNQAAMSAARLENRKIYYTTTDGKTIKPLNQYNVFNGPTIASNKYSNGQGVMTLTSDVIEIGSFAFSDCETLLSMKLPQSVKKVGYNTFMRNPNMTSVELNEGLESIDVMAFARNPKLAEVKIPQSVKKFGMAPFAMCPSLKRLEGKYVEGDGRYLVFNKELIGFAPAGLTECVVPEGVVSIQQEVLKECRELISVTLPEGLTTIGVSSLRDCESLREIEFPTTVTMIDMGAFYGCKSLTKVKLPEKLTVVMDNLFGNCASLAEVEIGAKVTKIEAEVFAECPALTTVICRAVTPPATGWKFLGGENENLVVKVPAESVDAYSKAEGWKEYTIEPIE